MVFLAGCSSKSDPPDTGAKETVKTYVEALIRQDWKQAYSVLDVDSKTRFSQEQFSLSAQNYCRRLGDPDKVIVQSCQEKGIDATAHVILMGSRRSKGAVSLRRTDPGWGIVLPSTFGQDN
jgi:hypothetical protein